MKWEDAALKRCLPKSFLQIVLLLLSLFIMATVCQAWTGRVVRVSEGDLLVISHDGKEKKYRLYGVECPERGQPYWEKALGLVTFLTEDRVVEVNPVYQGLDGYQNVLLRIQGTKEYLNQQLVAYGLAWVRPEECSSHMCAEWKRLQEMARTRLIGLWADKHPIPPWEWKKEHWKELLENQTAPSNSK